MSLHKSLFPGSLTFKIVLIVSHATFQQVFAYEGAYARIPDLNLNSLCKGQSVSFTLGLNWRRMSLCLKETAS